MISKPLLILAFSLWSCNLMLGQHGEDSVLNVASDDGHNDSIWSEVVYFNALAIPSYDELLEIYYESIVEVDSRLHFNPYRYASTYRPKVNPFVFSHIILPQDTFNIAQGESSVFAGETSGDDVLHRVKLYIASKDPQLMTSTWDMLPDPPENKKVEGIQGVDLDLRKLDRNRRKIDKLERIEKVELAYEPWQVSIEPSLNANQTAFSNWAKGGTNFVTLSARVLSDVDYISKSKKSRWENNIDFRLGYIQQEDKPFMKNLDLFRFNTQYAYKAINKWFYAINTEFSTQFFDGYDTNDESKEDPVTAFFSPAYLKAGIGLDYKYGTKQNKKIFSVQASPISYKMSLVMDTVRIDQTKFGIEANKKSRQEIGGSVQLSSEYALKDKLNTRSRLLLFSNYIENPEKVDVNWNSTITYHFSRIFAVTLTVDMIYDYDVDILLGEVNGEKEYGKRLQLKEFLGFGLTYRLM